MRTDLDGRDVAAVFAGGAIGTLARAGLSEAFVTESAAWPWATFVANGVGAFLLGWFATRLQDRPRPSSYLRPLLCTGLCGGLTTFATMQVEIVAMVEHDAYFLTAGYLLTSIGGGLAALRLGVAAAGPVWRRS